MGPSVSFYVTYALSLALGLLCVFFVSYWCSHWRGGFAWDGSALQFNWHPVLMVSGLVVLYGNAVVLYRAPFTWTHRKLTWKLVHTGLMLAALLLCILALQAVFYFHKTLGIPDMYSLHSWVGICTVAIFAGQWTLGAAVFLFPRSPMWLRSALKPVHVWIGKAVLILTLASCVSGINEKLLFDLNASTGEPYSSLPAEAKFANSLGILIVVYGLIVFAILSKKRWQRPDAQAECVHLLVSESGA